MASMKLSLELMVDKRNNRVVWAESGGDFVDVLFSFLTLPLGTAVRLLRKQSGLGRVDQLYQSVEDLDVSCFKEVCCKDMLLRPRNSSEHRRKDLRVNVDDDYDIRTIYTCRDKSCIDGKSSLVYSSFSGILCRCGGVMNRPMAWEGSSGEGGTGSLSKGEVLTLLQKSLSSKSPLTDMFFQKPECQQKEQPHPKTVQESTTCGKSFKARLVMSKSRDKLLYAEVGQDVVDLVFSFLTVPLGSIIRLLKKASHIGCMDNLYKSVENLCASEYCAKLEKHKDMLLAPKIAPHCGCSNRLLGFDESENIGTTMKVCVSMCSPVIPKPDCSHDQRTVSAFEINPKLGNGSTEKGGGFAKGRPLVFMMTDEMMVMLNSSVSAFRIMNGLEISADDIEEREVTLGEEKALDLLRALLLSRTPLTDVFCPIEEKCLQT